VKRQSASAASKFCSRKKKIKNQLYLRRCTFTEKRCSTINTPFKHANYAFLSVTQTTLHSRLRQKRKEKQHPKLVFFLYIILVSLFSFDQAMGPGPSNFSKIGTLSI